ncbi:formyltetrahydrofolate deformylase [Arachidicoccus sp.]|jgi:formyltetrahydrofolate deformylase|uniref:formyltetrahydrofolate deformylase n=1 Tax=Arachidicoccus sp. TaxID=1872624 RepID=UPI003D1AB525
MNELIILIQCSDEVGLVTKITQVLASNNLNIISMHEYVDTHNKKFFTRIACRGDDLQEEPFKIEMSEKLPHGAVITIVVQQLKKIAVLVTKDYHCLGDILVRNQFKTLGAQVQCVIGNYSYLQEVTQQFSVPYFHISHHEKDKQEFETEIRNVIDQFDIDFIVLAKFMRILSPEFVENYTKKIINIHHSFLPAFVGANPYKQAFDRGVKIIGATAHFVTNNLDEGPIITQHTASIDHTYGVKEMIRRGRETEKAVLLEALQLVFEDRVFISGNKTIVFK